MNFILFCALNHYLRFSQVASIFFTLQVRLFFGGMFLVDFVKGFLNDLLGFELVLEGSRPIYVFIELIDVI